MIKTLTAFAMLAGITAAPAAAVTYDAFSSFNGTQGAGNFFYGYGSDAYSNGTLFNANSNCFIAGSVCLQQSANGDVPGVTKSTATSFQYGSVNVPNDRLLLHPGNDGSTNGTVFVAFTAPTTGIYTYSIVTNVQDNSPSGILVGSFFNFFGPPPFLTVLIDGSNPSYAETGEISLFAGESFGLSFNRVGSYNNDSTGLIFSLSTATAAVPEPATWTLIITGFGLVGMGLRRRPGVTAA